MTGPLEPEDTENAHPGSSSAAGRTVRQRIGGMVALPGLLRELGLDPAPLIAEAGLSHDTFASPDHHAPFAALMHLVSLCTERSGLNHFPLLLGQRWNLSHFGPLGQRMRSAPTVGEALRIMVTHQHRHSDAGLAFLLVFEVTAAVGYLVYRDVGTDVSPAYDIATAFTANIARELCGPDWKPTEVLLARRAPPDPRVYRLAFGCPVVFDHEYCAVRFPSRFLDRVPTGQSAIARDDRVHAGADERFDPLEDLNRTVRLLLVEGLSSGDELARILELNRRTLSRRLRDRGVTFRQVLEEVRYDTARQLLSQTDAPIEEISAALCYSEVSAFTHAFRRWSQTTPGQYRVANRTQR